MGDCVESLAEKDKDNMDFFVRDLKTQSSIPTLSLLWLPSQRGHLHVSVSF